ncbi:YecA family protein [Myxococcus stipitatus]|uniref:YecA family protein n=1 Tax=Myxococcus stipitatus TaxID=83455 RepID=UPI0030CF8A79
MSQKKPGRNDPCPCGSGKKYKVCHAAQDRANAPPPSVPVHRPQEASFLATKGRQKQADGSYPMFVLERFGQLLAGWGPEPKLRFDVDAFDSFVNTHLARLTEEEAADAASMYQALFTGWMRELGAEQAGIFLTGLALETLNRSTKPGLSREDQGVLGAVSRLSLKANRPKGLPLEDHPIIKVVFDVQFREWRARHKEWLEKHEALLDESSLSEQAREALKQAREGNVDALLNYVKEDPELAERIAREAKERAVRVEAKLREPSTPPVFAPEEELWLTCVLWEPMQALKGLPSSAEPAVRREAVTALLRGVKGALDEDFLAGMLGRMREKAQDASLDEATRAWFTDASIAFEAEPARMALAALLTARQEAVGRSAEEMVALADLKALTTWTPEGFEPYRTLLLQMGLPASAERIARCQEWLRTHPVALRAAPE